MIQNLFILKKLKKKIQNLNYKTPIKIKKTK